MHSPTDGDATPLLRLRYAAYDGMVWPALGSVPSKTAMSSSSSLTTHTLSDPDEPPRAKRRRGVGQLTELGGCHEGSMPQARTLRQAGLR